MKDDTVTYLNQLEPGQRAQILALAGGRSFQTRLVDMGLNVGCPVELVKASCGKGGPALVAVGESRIAIGCGMASKIVVAVDPD